MSTAPALVWFRHDLRLADNPALKAAVERGGPVIPVFIWSPEEEGAWPPGAASRWWLHQSLDRLAAELEKAGSRLVIRAGAALEVLLKLSRDCGAGAVFWNRRYEPANTARDARLKEMLRSGGLDVQSFNAALLFEPWTVANKSGKPFQVFTPFWQHCLTKEPPAPPTAAPRMLPVPREWPTSLPLGALKLEPEINWTSAMNAAWAPGERGAHAQLERFLRSAVLDYSMQRDQPDVLGTSRLSPHLHFGEISPRQIWEAVRLFADTQGIAESTWRSWQFLKELGWREFAHHLLFHFPHTPDRPLRAEFSKFPWREDESALRAWQRGHTGYPIVDAGMRELWATGWMHNRVRMIAASFLVKDLLAPWTAGAQWFWDTLVDADLAQNTLGWQWTAGCGADAAPFFRIFNPVSQGEKFDPRGGYVRRWVPELARLPNEWIHRPWEAPVKVLIAAGVELGKHYPRPIVSHAIAREVALEAFSRLRGRGNNPP